MVQLRHAGAFLLTRTSVRRYPLVPLDQEAAAMAGHDFAQFRIISGDSETDRTDKAVTLVNGTGETSRSRHTVGLENLDSERGGVLMFQVSGTSGSHLQIVRQAGGHEQEIIAIDLDGTFTQPRSWHEVIAKGHLSPDQHLEMKASATPAGGTITVSDVVLFYHSHTA
jgi:hypothetical protein